MSRLVVQVTRREETSVATTVVELGPDQPVRYRSGDRVVNEVLQLERPLPQRPWNSLAGKVQELKLLRHVVGGGILGCCWCQRATRRR